MRPGSPKLLVHYNSKKPRFSSLNLLILYFYGSCGSKIKINDLISSGLKAIDLSKTFSLKSFKLNILAFLTRKSIDYGKTLLTLAFVTLTYIMNLLFL
jgi:hypothetical protein